MQIKEGKHLLDEGSDCGTDITDDADALREIHKRVREEIETAPSDASVQFILRRVGDGFKGLLRIRSSQSRFVGGASGNELSQVVNNIFNKVNSQIRGWKSTRELNVINTGSAWE